MKKKVLICVLALLGGGIGIVGCRKTTTTTPVDDQHADVSFAVPQGWPQPVYNFSNNPLTKDGFILGRKLFYDPRLSYDSSVACASCHQQFACFSHLDHPLSHGIYGQFGTRNAPPLENIAWQPAFLWDGGVNNVENQPINPIQNPVEMGETMPHIITKLKADATYRAMFKNAFGDETINSQRIFKALAQFMVNMVSDNSLFDKYMRGEAQLNQQQLHGLQLFRQKCESCHKEPFFTDFSYHNIGLKPNPSLNDSGRMRITGNPADLYKFKVPSLRNVAYSEPYMHDGRFNSLKGAIDHYRTGIYNSPTLDTALTNGITMSDQDEDDIISFLKTLSDSTYINDIRFSDPGSFQ